MFKHIVLFSIFEKDEDSDDMIMRVPQLLPITRDFEPNDLDIQDLYESLKHDGKFDGITSQIYAFKYILPVAKTAQYIFSHKDEIVEQYIEYVSTLMPE